MKNLGLKGWATRHSQSCKYNPRRVENLPTAVPKKKVKKNTKRNGMANIIQNPRVMQVEHQVYGPFKWPFISRS